jgi:hypothetical protein
MSCKENVFSQRVTGDLIVFPGCMNFGDEECLFMTSDALIQL